MKVVLSMVSRLAAPTLVLALWLSLALPVVAAWAASPPPAFPAAPSPPGVAVVGNLAWDAVSKEYTNKPGEYVAKFYFHFTNTSPSEVLIQSAQSSCFCTVAKLPAQPWHIPAGSNGTIEVTMDLAGKMGRVVKGVFVSTSAGAYNLTVSTTVTPPDLAGLKLQPTMNDADRLKNMQAALADRQAVFKRSECASCHADPAKGRLDGASLYIGVCANCHESPHRASTVPDLKALPHPTDFEHWKGWITSGKAGTMMPAFALAEGGPLSDPQITAIAQHLVRTIPSRAPVTTPGGGGSGAIGTPAARPR